jgi:DNA-binding NtrC family response regulator
VGEGRFREDLFHRLNVVRVHVPPLRERKDDIVHLANIFLQQFAALYRRPAHHFTAAAESQLEAYAWPGNIRELQNVVLNSVLFCDAPEVDVADLQGGFQALAGSLASAAPHPGPPLAVGALPAGTAPPAAPDPAQRLRKALATEIAALIGPGRTVLVPLGKWLAADLVLTAHRLSAGVSRRGADLLGLPETTYRRQLQAAERQRTSGQAVRSPGWSAVALTLEDLIRSRRDGVDVCQWGEACLLAEIEAAVPGDTPAAAALLGVTEPTMRRRKDELRQF